MPKDYPYYWDMRQPKDIRFSYEDSLGGYLFMYKKILYVLEVVLESSRIIEPYVGTQNLYVQLLEYFYSVQKRDDFKHIPPIDFKKFASLINVDEDLADEWKRQKPKYIDYLRLIDAEFRSIRYGDSFKIPMNLQLIMSPLDDNLQHHLDQVGQKQDFSRPQSYAEILFTAKSSKKRLIFEILFNHRNDWVNTKDILKKVKIKYEDLRSFISQIRKNIKNKKLSKELQIISERQSAYKLIVLAS